MLNKYNILNKLVSSVFVSKNFRMIYNKTSMIYGIIDIGSNSIRLLLSNGKVAIEDKKVVRTQLAYNLANTGVLDEEAMSRTIKVIIELVEYAKEKGANYVWPFATEAVRGAKNREVFLNRLKDAGIDVDLIPAQNEAKLGFAGAYYGGKVAVMDVGGASSEIAVGDENGLLYAKSIPIGIVKIKDVCAEDVNKAEEYIESKIKEYGEIPEFDTLISIGGTASSFAAIAMEMEVYDSKKVDFFKLTYDDIKNAVERIRVLPMEDRGAVKGLSLKRRDVIVGGGILIMKIMKKLNKDFLIVRESDNQEGYLQYKLGQLQM